MKDTLSYIPLDLPLEQLKLRIDYFVAFLVGFDDMRYQRIIRKNEKEFLDSIMAVLSNQEKKLISIRFGFIDGELHDLTECSRKMYITRAEVKVIFESAIAKLQEYISHIA